MKTQNLKHYQLCFLLLAFSFLLFTGVQCKKDKTGIDALPLATQEGKGTFGCLVNGVAFTPKGSGLIGPPVLTSYYQYLNSPTAQGYFFNVSADMNESGSSKSITIGANDVIIKQGLKYQLKNYPDKNEIYGRFLGVSNFGIINQYATISEYKGELFISKFDEVNQIVSGTFWFDAVNDKGDKVEVREGRFDVRFVK